MHQISDVHIANYRSIVDFKFPLSALTPLVGYNNAGKTNLLQAVNWLIKKSSLDAAAFNDKTKPVVVIATISGVDEGVLESLGQSHRQRIEPHLTDGAITIRRVQHEPNAKTTDVKLEIRQTTAEGEEVWGNPSGIDQAIVQLFPEPIFVGAMEDATEDVGKFGAGTTIGKLIKEIMAPIKEAHTDTLTDALAGLTQRLSAMGEQKDQTLVNLDERIRTELVNFFPGVTAKTHIPTPSLDDFFKGATIRIFEEGYEGDGRDAGSFGHGAQRSVQIALITCLSKLKHDAGAMAGRTTLLLIDEPELYLHPQAIEVVRASLARLSSDGYQVIFTTHSPMMISRHDAPRALLIRRNEQVGTNAYPRLEQAVFEAIAEAESQAETLFVLTNSSKILFSEKVVLAEGKTERTVLPDVFAHEAGATLEERKTALIALGGSHNIPNAMHVLQAMQIPVRAVVDLDFAFRVAQTHDLLPANHNGILGCRAILADMAAAGEITLDENGLPKSGDQGSAEKAYVLMAEKPGATPHIEQIHTDLLQANVWCWVKGAIEEHLGLQGKTTNQHYVFLKQFRQDGFCDALPNYDAVRQMLAWIQA